MSDKYLLCQGCGKRTKTDEIWLCETWNLGITLRMLCTECKNDNKIRYQPLCTGGYRVWGLIKEGRNNGR